MRRAEIYVFTFDADFEPDEELKHDVNYKTNGEMLTVHFVVKAGDNSFQAASIAFNQSWRELRWKFDKILYKPTRVYNVRSEYKNFDMNLWLGAALEAQLPETIEELMTCWKSVNPEKNRNVQPKER